MRRVFKLVGALLAALILTLTGTTVYNYFRTPAILEEYMWQEIVEYKFNQLPVEYQDILIKVQDPGFYEHKGVDLRTPGAGWTTITQSLAKSFYFKDFKQGWRKIPQTLFARFALHPRVEKESQLDLFINIMGFGNETRGILAASLYYFDSRPEELTREEFIALIATLNSPNTLNPKDNPDANKERSRRIKRYLDGEYTPRNVFDNEYVGA